MSLSKRATAEFIGTFWLVFGGCGSAVLAAAFPSLGIGFAGVALAFGLTVLTMAYAIPSVWSSASVFLFPSCRCTSSHRCSALWPAPGSCI